MILRKGIALCSVLTITVLLTMPQVASSVGTCRKGPNCEAQEQKCDPNLWKEYERRKKVAEELFEAAKLQRKEIKDEASKFFWEQLKGMGEVTAIKGPPVTLAGKLRQMALRYVGSPLSSMEEKVAALNQARAFGAVVEGAELGGMLGTALWIDVLGSETQQLNAEWADNEKMMAEAQRQLDKALEAFKADFAQREACDKDRQRLKAEEKLADKARALMNDWDTGAGLYRDPSGQMLDSGAAFKRAKEILSASRSHMDGHPHIWLAADAGQATAGSVTVTREQLEAAIQELRKGVALFGSGMDALIQELSFQEQIDSKLNALK